MFLREPLGLEDEVLVETTDGTRVKSVTSAEVDRPEGTSVGLELATRDLYVFHPESKATLCNGVD